MTIAFFGHADFRETALIKERLLSLLEKEIGGKEVSFLLGGYGAFDEFARRCTREYQTKNPNCTLVLVTPYMTISHQKNVLSLRKDLYDEILYPPIENVHPHYAIIHRNRYMGERADLVIAYVTQKSGGAYQAVTAAKRRGVRVLNLAEYEK